MRLTPSPVWTSTCRRHKHITLETASTNYDALNKQLKFDYNITVIYLKLLDLLVIYIDVIFPPFNPFKDEILVLETPTSLHEKKSGRRQWVVIFCNRIVIVNSRFLQRPQKGCRGIREPAYSQALVQSKIDRQRVISRESGRQQSDNYVGWCLE